MPHAKLAKREVDSAVEGLLQSMRGKRTSKRAAKLLEEAQADEAKIAHHEAEAAALQTVLTALEANIQIRMSSARQARNSLARIHRLPSEVLLRVFTMVLEGARGAAHYRLLNKILKVSKTFYHLINNSPSMWSVVWSNHPESVRRTLLAKSKSHPLAVDIDWDSVGGPSTVLEWVMGVRNRVQSVDALSAEARMFQNPLFQSPAPKLEQLTLSTNNSDIILEDLEIFGGSAPCLRHVRLSGVLLKLESSLMTGLRSLEIKRLLGGEVAIERILGVMERCPYLEKLQLDMSFTEAAIPADRRPVFLKRLTDLSINLSSRSLAALLKHLRVPQVRNLSVKCRERGSQWHVPRSFDGSLEQFIPLLHKILATAGPRTPASIKLDRSSIAFTLGRVELDIIATNFNTWFDFISRTITEAPTTQVTFLLSLGLNFQFLRDETLEKLTSIERVKSLEIFSRSDANGLFRHLAKPLRGGQWPWPILGMLYLDTNGDPNELLKTVKSRYGRVDEAGGATTKQKAKQKSKGKGKGKSKNKSGTTVALPLPLQDLHIRSLWDFDDAIYDELIDIVGEDEMYWSEPEEEAEEDTYDDYGFYDEDDDEDEDSDDFYDFFYGR